MRRFLVFLGIFFALNAPGQNNIGWSLVWSDEFSQPDGTGPDPTKWTNDVGGGGWGNEELEYYTPGTNNARIQNGQLVIEARQESFGGENYTSARLKTQNLATWQYGRMEARIKIPQGRGIWPACWMMGDNVVTVGWPQCGEVDIMENQGNDPATVFGNLNGPGYAGHDALVRTFSLPDHSSFASDFHVYAVEWTTNRLEWSVDGFVYSVVTPQTIPAGGQWVYDHPQFLVLNVAVGGLFVGPPDGSTVFPQQMIVDYVRIYAPTNLPDFGANELANPGFEDQFANWFVYGGGNNAVLATESNAVLVHGGTNAFKVFGQYNGGTNFSGVIQEVPAAAGQCFSAHAWAITLPSDKIVGGNMAWLAVSFLDSSSNVLSLYLSSVISASSPAGAWTDLVATNQIDPFTFAIIGATNVLAAPGNTSFVHYQIVFDQPATDGGSVYFDDLTLLRLNATNFSMPLAAGLNGKNLNLNFPAYLGLPFELQQKTNLLDPQWVTVTNLTGDGMPKTVGDTLSAPSRFYRLLRSMR